MLGFMVAEHSNPSNFSFTSSTSNLDNTPFFRQSASHHQQRDSTWACRRKVRSCLSANRKPSTLNRSTSDATQDCMGAASLVGCAQTSLLLLKKIFQCLFRLLIGHPPCRFYGVVFNDLNSQTLHPPHLHS